MKQIEFKAEILKIINNKILIFYTNHNQLSLLKIKIIELKVVQTKLQKETLFLRLMEKYNKSKCIPHILSHLKIQKITKGIQIN